MGSKGLPILHQGRITEYKEFSDWVSFLQDFVSHSYPKEQSSKFETYSFVPTSFSKGFNRPKDGREPVWGHWRLAEHADDTLSLIVMDCDNANSEHDMVDMEDAAFILMNLNANYIIYSSFSSTAEQPKYRIIVQPDRHMTYDEVYDATRWFNDLFSQQLDLSITDAGDHNFCIPFDSKIMAGFEGIPLVADNLKTGKPILRNQKIHTSRVLTPEEREKLVTQCSSFDIASHVTIRNTNLVPAKFISDLQMRYKEGSHSQSLMGTLSRIWLRNNANFTFGEMVHLFNELDEVYGGYVGEKYGIDERNRAIKSVMSLPSNQSSNLNKNLTLLRKFENGNFKSKR